MMGSECADSLFFFRAIWASVPSHCFLATLSPFSFTEFSHITVTGNLNFLYSEFVTFVLSLNSEYRMIIFT